MQDIPESSLENLDSRVAYLSSFIDFTAEDAAALHAAKPVLGPLVPTVVDLVYTKLLNYSITAKAFVPRQSGYEGEAPTSLSDLNLEHPQIAFRKDFLKGYIVKLVSMDYEDAKSWEYLDKVGRMHTGVEDSGFKHRAKRPGLRVEFIHCAILLGYVEDIIISTVISHPDLDTATKLAVCKAVNKILWIQNDLFARHYIAEQPSPEAAAAKASSERPLHRHAAVGALVPAATCLLGFVVAKLWKH